MNEQSLVSAFATLIQARENCVESGNDDWFGRHTYRAEKLAREFLPSGSGFDSASYIDLAESKPNRLVFSTSYHHMNDGGFYDGWSEHNVIVTPSLTCGFDLRITGRDRREIKDYIAECFESALSETRADWHAESGESSQ